MATYCTFDQRRRAYKYQRRVEPDLIPWLGAWLRKSLGGDKHEATRRARLLAVQHDALFARLRAMPEALRAYWVREEGGAPSLPFLRAAIKDIDGIRQAWAAHPHTEPAVLDVSTVEEIDAIRAKWAAYGVTPPALPVGSVDGRHVLTLEETMRCKFDAQVIGPWEANARATVAALEPVPAAAAEFSFDGLLELWREARHPKRWDNHQRTAGLLTKVLGKATDYRTVDGDAIGRFRDALAKEGKGFTYQKKHLEQASAMFAAAIDKRAFKGATNPCSGIKPDGKEDRRATKAPFSGPQLRTILATAERERFGRKRHEFVMWALRALIFSGARPEEVLGMQRGDVVKVDGVPVMIFRETCCATGVKLKEKSIKNDSSWRTVPLHPALFELLDFAAQGDPAEFLFECFAWKPVKYRRTWWDDSFAPFVRDVCGIEPGVGEKHSLTSIRQRFHDAMEHAKIGGKHERILTGHAAPDIHETYKRGKNLKLLAADVARVDVLAD